MKLLSYNGPTPKSNFFRLPNILVAAKTTVLGVTRGFFISNITLRF